MVCVSAICTKYNCRISFQNRGAKMFELFTVLCEKKECWPCNKFWFCLNALDAEEFISLHIYFANRNIFFRVIVRTSCNREIKYISSWSTAKLTWIIAKTWKKAKEVRENEGRESRSRANSINLVLETICSSHINRIIIKRKGITKLWKIFMLNVDTFFQNIVILISLRGKA